MSLPRHRLADDLGPHFRRSGYVVVTDLVAVDQLREARERILALFNRRLARFADGSTPEELLVRTYASQPELWRQCARRMWDVLPVYRLGGDERIAELLRKLDLADAIVSTRPEVRTDMPGDDRYMQPWHQDWRYGQGSLNAVTLWLPLHDVDASRGTIELMPGSHLLGYLDVEELENPRRFSIRSDRLPDLPVETAELRLGEAIVFSQFLVHRSGYNSSGRPRITVQARFADAADPRFVERGYPVSAGSELVWDEPPGEDDLRSVFGVEAGNAAR
jgi:phytanoyl-CoA hydroxylase